MKQSRALTKHFLAFGIFTILLTAFSMSAKAGLDSYAIYLNDKLILKQHVNQPLSLQSLQLTKANANDKLVIYYSQCNVPNKIGKGRSLVIRDNAGNIVKEWKFGDGESEQSSMIIPVKDLLQLEKNIALENLNLFYTAKEMSKDQKLMSLKVNPGSTSLIATKKRKVAA